VTNKMLTSAAGNMSLRSKWRTLSIYDRLGQSIVATVRIAIGIVMTVTGWQLLLHTLRLRGAGTQPGCENMICAHDADINEEREHE